jgi:hypothetical protein
MFDEGKTGFVSASHFREVMRELVRATGCDACLS